MSLNYAPFDLAYADFDADHYLRSLTMPLLVNYGAYDTAMPIEQGAQRIIDAARSAGNENVTVRYFVGNHQMRAGKGLFTLNLPLAQGYTQALENWVNGIAAALGLTDGPRHRSPECILISSSRHRSKPSRVLSARLVCWRAS